MKKYVATRKDICAGTLIKTCEMSFKIVDVNDNEISRQELAKRGITNISFSGGLVCRGMLFNVNEDGLTNDLIYTTPTNYPIKDRQTKVDVESQFVIDHYVELEELLKYLKYGVDLTQSDLNQIYKRLITHNWWLNHHMKLFGWEKSYDENTGRPIGYGSGGTQTIPMNIYDNLSWISCSNNGKPCIEEPGYSLIKKRK